MPAIPSVTGYTFASPNSGQEAATARATAQRISSHVPVDEPHLAFVNATAQAAFATLDRVAAVSRYRETTTYPTSGLGQALKAVAGAMVIGIGHEGVLRADRRLRHARVAESRTPPTARTTG